MYVIIEHVFCTKKSVIREKIVVMERSSHGFVEGNHMNT